MLVERTPFFYGWAILGATMLTTMATLPGQTVGVSVFLDGIIEDLGTNRSVVSSLYTAATLLGATVLPFVGRFVDRRGPRIGVAVVGAGLVVACLFMSVVSSLAMLAVAFFGLRSMGQGSLGLVSQYTANQWFVRRRGVALGLSIVGYSIGIALVGGVFTTLSDSFGWQGAYRVLAAAVAVIVTVFGVGVFRERPEVYGREPDGGAPAFNGTPLIEPSVRPEVARRTAVFWLFTLGTASTSALSTGLQFHHFSIMAEAGMSRGEAALFFAPFGLANGVFNIASGWLVDRFPHRYVMAAGQVLLAMALWSAPVLDGRAQLVAYGIVLGAMAGIGANVAATAFAHHFGRLHLGEIKGIATTATIGASALGPLPFALGFDFAGGYVGVLRAAAAIPLSIVIWAVVVRMSHEPDVEPPAPSDPRQHGERGEREQAGDHSEPGPVGPQTIDRPTE